MFHDLLVRLRSLLRRNKVEAELDDELRFHREGLFESYVRSGLSPQEARRKLTLEFGGVDQIKEESRQARGVSAIEHLIQDVRYGMRSLRRTPAFALVAILTLALGLGANTAIYSVVYNVLLRPLPYASPDALIVMHETTPKVGEVSVSYPNFQDWRSTSRTFQAMSIVASLDVNLGGAGRPESISVEAVSSNYLTTLGIHPMFGRDFTAAEDAAGSAPVALLSHALWQKHFDGSRDVLGKSISLDGHPISVIGVLPASMAKADSASLLLSAGVWQTSNEGVTSRSNRGDSVVVGRLAPGVTIDRARAEMEGIAAELARVYPEANAQFGVALQPLHDSLVGDTAPALLVLFGAVLCVLLIACANVANLSLIRAAGRTREIALRVAIGASRRRIVSQLLVESGILAVAGGALGLALAVGGIRAINWLIPSASMGDSAGALDGQVLAFAAVAALLTTFVFGLVPALQAAGRDLTGDLKEGVRTGGTARRPRRWRAMLATAEIALALVLLVGAGLLMRSLSKLIAVDPGVRTENVLTLSLALRSDQYSDPGARRSFWQRVLDEAKRLPGVEAAALGTGVPLTDNHSRSDISIEGIDHPMGALPHPDVHRVSPGYIDTLSIRVLAGRTFSDADNENVPRVALVNRSLAQKYFHDVDPIGRRFIFGRQDPAKPRPWITIVGVVEDTKLYGLDNPSRLEVYLAHRQSVTSEAMLILRSATDPSSLAASVRSIVASIDPDQPVVNVATMVELRNASMSTRRVTFALLALFSALALTLAGIGVYGVMSYSVAQRTNELGIRLALGASRTDLLATVAGQGARICAVGIAIGVAVALGLTRGLDTLLFSVSAVDPATFIAVVVGVAIVALAACAIPGWRATRIDPLRALRSE